MRNTIAVLGKTVSRLFSTRSLCILNSGDSVTTSTSSGDNSLTVMEEVAVIAVDAVISNHFFPKSVLRKLENCNNSSGRLASRSVGYAI